MKGFVLAAHGSLYEASTNASVCAWADRLSEVTGSPVGVGFHRGSPSFANALDSLCEIHPDLQEVTVIPLMTSAGYYSKVVLPRELARNRRACSLTLRLADPVGLAAGLPGLILERIRQRGDDPSVLVVGHGTPRHRDSRRATECLVGSLAPLLPVVAAAFLDESPSPAEALQQMPSDGTVLVIPFLIGSGYHASVDVTALACRQRVICDDPVGTYPGLLQLILEVTGGCEGGMAPLSHCGGCEGGMAPLSHCGGCEGGMAPLCCGGNPWQ